MDGESPGLGRRYHGFCQVCQLRRIPPEARVQDKRGPRTHEIDVFLEGFKELLLDNMEMLSDDSYDVYCHPEAILVNTVFGPAYCDGFGMHERYILLLKTM